MITFNHTTVIRTPLDKWSARRTDLYQTAHNTHKRETSMPQVGFEPAIPASERPQTHALDCAATGIGSRYNLHIDSIVKRIQRSRRLIPDLSICAIALTDQCGQRPVVNIWWDICSDTLKKQISLRSCTGKHETQKEHEHTFTHQVALEFTISVSERQKTIHTHQTAWQLSSWHEPILSGAPGRQRD